MLNITLLIMMSFFFNTCKLQTFESLSQNFCQNLGEDEDNLSCPGVAEQTGSCLPRGSLCDGVQNCSNGADEGVTMPNLTCGECMTIQASSNLLYVWGRYGHGHTRGTRTSE